MIKKDNIMSLFGLDHGSGKGLGSVLVASRIFPARQLASADRHMFTKYKTKRRRIDDYYNNEDDEFRAGKIFNAITTTHRTKYHHIASFP